MRASSADRSLEVCVAAAAPHAATRVAPNGAGKGEVCGHATREAGARGRPLSPGRRGWLVALCFAAIATACGEQGAPRALEPRASGRAGEAARAAFEDAIGLWQRRHPDAFAAWRAIPAPSREAAEAEARLAHADTLYVRGIEELRGGVPTATSTLREAMAIAPMNPEHYLVLARICRDRGFDARAAEMYKKFLLGAPRSVDVAAARTELAQVEPDGDLAGLFDAPAATATASNAVSPPRGGLAIRAPVDAPQPAPVPHRTTLPLTFGSLTLGFTVIAFLLLRRRRREHTLRELVTRRPELGPAVAYLIGCVRHELLKHRVSASADAIRALQAESASATDRAFVRERLFGGESIAQAWQGHLDAFERALGPGLSLDKGDPAFRRADRAIRSLSRVASRATLDAVSLQAIASAHATLLAFDGELAALARQLVRTPVDRALLEEVVASVRTEYSVSLVALDALELFVDPELEPATGTEVALDVFRVDLVVVLKNLVRNAVLAVGRHDGRRAVRVGVALSMEATGEDVVTLFVEDTSPVSLDVDVFRTGRLDHGLGLVAAALRRYDGVIDVLPGEDGFAKRVAVRFFRAASEEVS